MKTQRIMIVFWIGLIAALSCNLLSPADQELVPPEEPTAVEVIPTAVPELPTEEASPTPHIPVIVLIGHKAVTLGDAAYTIQTEGGFVVHVNEIVPDADLVLFTINAPDGPMPGFVEGLNSLVGQTVPHAAILLTQTELLTDPELQQLELVEVREILSKYTDAAQVDQLEVLDFSDPELISKLQGLLSTPPMNLEIHARS